MWPGRLRDLAGQPHLPKRTVRLRLTALYGALFFPLGVALVVNHLRCDYLVVPSRRPGTRRASTRTRQDHRRPIRRSWSDDGYPSR
jgi:hypothetical protein